MTEYHEHTSRKRRDATLFVDVGYCATQDVVDAVLKHATGKPIKLENT